MWRARLIQEHPVLFGILLALVLGFYAYMACSTPPQGPAGKWPGWTAPKGY